MTLPDIDVDRLADQFLDQLPCKAKLPYPETKGIKPNADYGDILLDAYANGESAELTAVTQYIHHHLTISDKKVSNLELCVALVEMRHLSLVGDTLEALGVDPKYFRSNKFYWSGGVVPYGGSLCEKLRMDIEGERAAINGYIRIIPEIKDPVVQSILKRIIEDEKVHLELFKEALAEYCR